MAEQKPLLKAYISTKSYTSSFLVKDGFSRY